MASTTTTTWPTLVASTGDSLVSNSGGASNITTWSGYSRDKRASNKSMAVLANSSVER